jgi:hypothetical protein
MLTPSLSCRLKLRMSGLATRSSFVVSVSICVHAAQGVLAGYHQIYKPVLNLLCGGQVAEPNSGPDELTTPNAAALPVTWRQVRRIMTSVFVVIFAYQHGQVLHDEASRSMALTRLLLEYPRWRWGRKMEELIHALYDISSLANLAILKHLRALLPNQTDEFLQHLSTRQSSHPSRTFPTNQDMSTHHYFSPYWPPLDNYPYECDVPGISDSLQGSQAQQFWNGIFDPTDVL